MRTTRTSLLVAALASGLLAGSAVGAAAQDETDALQVVTEEVEPGVERIISDSVGHDLDETHPDHRLDIDGIAIAPDGTVWLTTTTHGADNIANASVLIWALGQPGTYTHDHGLPEDKAVPNLVTLADGALLAVAVDEVFRYDGDRFVPDDRLPRHMEDADLADQLPEGQVAGPESEGSRILEVPARWEVSAGDYWCRLDGGGWNLGVDCGQRGGPMMTTYLARTVIGQIAAAPDGSVWAVGNYDHGPGGLYRITLPPAE